MLINLSFVDRVFDHSPIIETRVLWSRAESEVLGTIDLCEFPPYGRDVHITFLASYLKGKVKAGSDAHEVQWLSPDEIERLEEITPLTRVLSQLGASSTWTRCYLPLTLVWMPSGYPAQSAEEARSLGKPA